MALKFAPQQLGIVATVQVPGKTAENYFTDKGEPGSLATIQKNRMLANRANAKWYLAKFNSLLAIPEVRAWLLGDAAPSKAELVWTYGPRMKRARKVRRGGRTTQAKTPRRGAVNRRKR